MQLHDKLLLISQDKITLAAGVPFLVIPISPGYIGSFGEGGRRGALQDLRHRLRSPPACVRTDERRRSELKEFLFFQLFD
jgi:hypothetical protein